ncbi:MAG: hypothetical protein LUG16_03420, partial [Candidatus Gastranaerophilales bacterium]|nr:hypothetical protein [Candidatus Gastranaerophilales bacterium]
NLNINYSKKILKKMKNETIESFDKIYKRAAIVLGFMLSCLIILSLYMGYNYINEAFAKNPETSKINTIEFPKEEDWVEFTFDNNEALLTLK